MKQLKLVFGILIGILILSCSDDGDNIKEKNITGKLIVNGEHYELTKGFIIPNYTGSDPNYDSRRYYFILTNNEVSLDNNDFTYSDGITQLIDFNMYSSIQSSGNIENTIYPIFDYPNPNFDSDNAFLDHSSIRTNVIFQNGNHVSSDMLSSDDMEGEVTIFENNGIYTVSFSYSNEQNIVSGNFEGNLTDLNYQY